MTMTWVQEDLCGHVALVLLGQRGRAAGARMNLNRVSPGLLVSVVDLLLCWGSGRNSDQAHLTLIITRVSSRVCRSVPLFPVTEAV